MIALTKRQRQVMDFIKSYWAKHRVSPTYAEIAEHIGKSRTNAYQLVLALAGRGAVEIKPNVARGITVIE